MPEKIELSLKFGNQFAVSGHFSQSHGKII